MATDLVPLFIPIAEARPAKLRFRASRLLPLALHARPLTRWAGTLCFPQVVFRARFFIVFLFAGPLALGFAVASAYAASATTLSPANGASVTIQPRPGFGNGPLTLRWSVEFSDCPGDDILHDSFPEIRPKGAGQPDWQQVPHSPHFGPGTFADDAFLDLPTSPVAYEWRIRWQCGGYGTAFPGAVGYSPIAAFTLLPESAAAKCVVPNLKGKTMLAARAALQKANCKLGAVRRAYSSKVKKGRVISQKPVPGTRQPAQTRVNVVLSRGRRP
jgi:PASTA domain-containing protein